MDQVRFFTNKIDSQLWHGVEKIAFKRDNVVRCLAIPLGLIALARGILIMPAACVEQSILVGKSIKAYKIEKDATLFAAKKKEMNAHLGSLSALLIIIPIAPLIAVIGAIVTIVKTVIWPLKTARTKAARGDFDIFVKETGYKSKTKVTFKEKVADAIFDRYKEKIKSAKNAEEIKEIPFVNDENFKTQIVAEVALKKQKYHASKNV